MSMNRWEYLQQLIAQQGGGVWKPFAYATDALALDNGAAKVLLFSVNMVDNQPFIWTDGLYCTTNASVQAGTDTTNGGLLIKFDEVTGMGQGGNSSWPIASMFGIGGHGAGPRELTVPVVFAQGRGTIAGQLTNQTGGAVTVILSFIGIKRYSN